MTFFRCLGIEVKGADIEDCHRLGYTNPKNTIVRFVNRKFCYQALDKEMELHKLDSKRLDFNSIKTLHFTENFTPLSQLLAWKCGEGLHDSQYMEYRSMIRIRRTANKKAQSIKNDNDLKSLYPDFVFRNR